MALDGSQEHLDAEALTAQTPEAATQFINLNVESFLARRTPEQKKFIVSRFALGLSTEEKKALSELLTGEIAAAAESAQTASKTDTEQYQVPDRETEAETSAVSEASAISEADAKGYDNPEDVDLLLTRTNPEHVKEMASQILAGLSVEDKTTMRDYLNAEVAKAEEAGALSSDEQDTLAHETALGEGVGQTSEPEAVTAEPEDGTAVAEGAETPAEPDNAVVVAEVIVVEGVVVPDGDVEHVEEPSHEVDIAAMPALPVDGENAVREA